MKGVLNRPFIALTAALVTAFVITAAVLIGRWSAPAAAAPARSEPAPVSSSTQTPHPDRTEWVNGHLLRVGSICLLARPC